MTVPEALSKLEAHASLNAAITVVRDSVCANANGALANVPFAHKDIFCTNGVRTTAGSRMLANFVPPYDATVHEKLVAAGAVMVAKANMDEFAMGSSNEH